jgi:hypothetical protein
MLAALPAGFSALFHLLDECIMFGGNLGGGGA